MKKYIVLALSVALGFTSCYKEPVITIDPNDDFKPRFEFPQGTNAWDADIVEIAEKFRTNLIYTDLTPMDFNITWKPAGLGGKMGSSLPDEETTRFYVSFMKNQVFRFLNPELTKRVFPAHIYLAYDVYSPAVLTDPATKEEFFMGNAPAARIYEGMDFWSLCLKTKSCEVLPHPRFGTVPMYKNIALPATVEDVEIQRGILLKKIIEIIVEKGNIKVPDAFFSDFDYTTRIEYKSDKANDPNFVWKRGFPGRISSAENIKYALNNSITQLNGKQLFVNYMHLAMLYTRDEILAGQLKAMSGSTVIVSYNQTAYPKIIQYYDLVVNYLKDEYGWDLEQIPANRGLVIL